MQVQQQAYLQHALNAFDNGCVREALLYVSHLESPLAPNVWALIAERLAAAPISERFRHAWCMRILDVPEEQRACTLGRFLHALWRVPLMQVQGRALACPACRIRVQECALEPRCEACRKIEAAFAVCATCGFRHGPICLECEGAHPAAVPCAFAAHPSTLSMGAGLYMPTYLRAVLNPAQRMAGSFKRRTRDEERRDEARGRPIERAPGPSRVSLILSRGDPARVFDLRATYPK